MVDIDVGQFSFCVIPKSYEYTKLLQVMIVQKPLQVMIVKKNLRHDRE
jgi:hypothetical protein